MPGEGSIRPHLGDRGGSGCSKPFVTLKVLQNLVSIDSQNFLSRMTHGLAHAKEPKPDSTQPSKPKTKPSHLSMVVVNKIPTSAPPRKLFSKHNKKAPVV